MRLPRHALNSVASMPASSSCLDRDPDPWRCRLGQRRSPIALIRTIYHGAIAEAMRSSLALRRNTPLI